MSIHPSKCLCTNNGNRKEWSKYEAFKDWITSPEAHKNKDHCKYCMCDQNAKYIDLRLHAQCQKHKKSLPSKAVTLTTSFVKPGNNGAHNIEGCIAMFLSCHCAITNCDHMVDMLNISNCKATDDAPSAQILLHMCYVLI